MPAWAFVVIAPYWEEAKPEKAVKDKMHKSYMQCQLDDGSFFSKWEGYTPFEWLSLQLQ